MDRRIASIQLISNIEPIPDGDNIECLTIQGWRVVSRKGDFKIGDICVYIEIDAVLPERPEFEFLRKNCWVDNGVVKGFHIRTMTMRGQLSQGLALPISILRYDIFGYREKAIGNDVTEHLGVVKFKRPIPKDMEGKMKDTYPAIPKSSEMRIQSIYPEIKKDLEGVSLYSTVKMDGTSSTIYIKNGELGVCAHEYEFVFEPNSIHNIYFDMFKKYDFWKILRELHGYGNIAIIGEICGPGIRKNRMNIPFKKFYVFDVFDIEKQEYFDYHAAFSLCKQIGLEMVPVERVGFQISNDITIEQLLDMAEGLYEGTLNQREGIIIRALYNNYSKVLSGRLSFKIVNNKYLLKNED